MTTEFFPTPLTLTDEDVRAHIRRIQANKYLTQEQKYNALDSLTFLVWNKHLEGLAAKVLTDISKAIEELCTHPNAL